MKKAIVVTAIGPQYGRLFGAVAPTFERYAARHDWDIHVVTHLPNGFAQKYSRPDWDDHQLFATFRLYQPSMFPDYDLLALIDPDVIIHPQAPCLSEYDDQMPSHGVAAVQDVTFAERKLFPSWRTYHYNDFLPPEQVARLPFPELHVNGGLMLVRPSEIKDEFLDLLTVECDYSDEDRVNLSFTQHDRVLFLPKKWNVVYPYERARRGYKAPRRPKNKMARRAVYHFDVRVLQQRMIRDIFRDVWMLHFASTDKNVVRHLDISGLLSLG